MPQREIVLEDAKVRAKYNGVEYYGKDLSDEERITLYLRLLGSASAPGRNPGRCGARPTSG